jgi:pyruvate/2-oxoglutarate dehydrogenase complex dihydrolipoamide acyltransferase (E2) component
MIASIPLRRRFARLPKAPLAALVGAALATALLALTGDSAIARSSREREAKRDDSVLSRPAGQPLMAIVALGEQRVTIFDADGRILRAPVSTGQRGYETPAGIYSVIQKEAEHYSNLYDDASMPFMQRITWSGIALHAGVLPGHPASHGCIRMPHGFAERLFGATSLGMRVIVVPSDVTPVSFSHPALFKPKPLGSEVSLAAPASAPAAQDQPMRLGAGMDGASQPPPTIPPKRLQTLKSIAAAKAVEAEAAAKKADEAHAAAARVGQEGARFLKAQRLAEVAKARADAALRTAQEALATANAATNPNPVTIERVQETKTRAETKVAEAQAQLDAAKTAAEPKADALARAREEVKTAEAAKTVAVAAAKEAAAKMSPVSVFISRQTQRVYVRQGFQAIFDMPVTIEDAEKPIGTYVYTALDYVNDGADVRWSVISMTSSHEATRRRSDDDEDGYTRSRRSHRGERNAEPHSADVTLAKAALDRVSLPQEAVDRISEVVSPGSAVIISDEALSKETGKGTDFVVLMSGEPQGGIKIRRRPDSGRDYERPYGYRRSPYYSPYGRNPYGGSPSFWW